MNTRSLRDAIRAVIIDLDGTLLDTIPDLAAASNAMRVDLGLPPLSQQTIARYVGKGAEILVHRALTDSLDGRVAAEHFERGMAAFHHHYERENGRHARLYPGVAEGLAAMRALGLRLACVTNKPQQFADPLLVRAGLAPYFELTLGGDALPRRKPDPLPLLHVGERFGAPPAQTLMIGDSSNDARAARAAGMPVLVVPYGYNEGQPVSSIDADGVVESLLQAADWIAAR
ncbi:MAG: phosphoglycolate phosphatase [Burkholderiales bacterium]|nr:phosphoglycolate phosphatase [Burkholderiales bacterium]